MALQFSIALLAIHLTTATGVPAKTLSAAQAEAAHILASAGFRVQWAAHGDLQLQIVGAKPRGTAADTAGFAVLIRGGAGYGAVSWPAVERESAQMGIDPAILLGAAMAHELGHLLFGPAHARSGVMAARLGPREMALAGRGELLFEGRTAGRPIAHR